MRVLGKILYWTAVLAISIVLLIVLVLFFESRDSSQVDNGTILLGALAAVRNRLAAGSWQLAEPAGKSSASCELPAASQHE
jgi:lipoprotein signal peptidase